MGDLVVGSVVFDQAGEPTAVAGVFDQAPERDCYEVVFSDGSVIVADGDHLWETMNRAGVRAVLDTLEVLATLRTASRELNHRVAVAGVVHFPERDLPTDPYTLGVRLGGGPTPESEPGGHAASEWIPSAYLRSHEKQRLSLPSGLMDSHGTSTSVGTVQFTSENMNLCRDVRTPVASSASWRR
jgi:replicative DNA helicase